MFTITRKEKTFGHYIPGKWININQKKIDEIAINSLMFGKYPMKEILQTIVHEMCHLWQEHKGSPPRRGYHDKEWAEKMESIGLMPSHNGRVGGKKLGQNMADYIISNGSFEKATELLIYENIFSKLWYDVSMPYLKGLNMEIDTIISNNTEKENTFNIIEPIDHSSFELSSETSTDNLDNIFIKPNNNIKSKKKTKYTCPNCKTNLWGKDDLYIICGACSEDFEKK